MHINTIQMIGLCIILMFLKEVSFAHQAFIYLIKNTVKPVILEMFF